MCGTYEIRFELDAKDCDALIASLERHGAEPGAEIRDFALYLDAPGAPIGNHGLALKIHRAGTITSDDIKMAVNSAARLPPPNGWTRSVEPLSAATPVGARRWLQSFLRSRSAEQSLCVLFQIETHVSPWRVTSGNADCEVRLERARITANRQQESAALVTFSRHAGPEAKFFRFVEEICKPAKVRRGADTIALRGYRFCGSFGDSHLCAFAPKLTADMDTAMGFQTVARACFDHFLLNEAAIRMTRGGEAVHQCRVALRRLFTSLRLFASLVCGPARDELRLELKELDAHLQRARDLDVFIAEVIEPAIGHDPAVQDLLHKLEVRRQSAYDELVAVLAAARTAKLFNRLTVWIEAGDWTSDCRREGLRREPLESFAARKLFKITAKFKERCDTIESATPQERHRIRLRGKNLRYSAEFFETLFAPMKVRDTHAHHKTARKRFQAFVAVLKDLQNSLGKESDAHMARRFLASQAQEVREASHADAGGAMLSALELIAQRVESLSEPDICKAARKARRSLAEVKPFWRQHVETPVVRRRSKKIRPCGTYPRHA